MTSDNSNSSSRGPVPNDSTRTHEPSGFEVLIPEELRDYPEPPKLMATLLHRPPDAWAFRLALLLCLIAGVFTFFAQGRGPEGADVFAAELSKIQSGEVWRAWTSILLHADFAHWLANSLGLMFFSGMLISYYGLPTYALLLLVAGPFVQYLTLFTYRNPVHLMGASGVVYLFGAVWLTLYVFTERGKRVFSRILRAAGISLVVLAPSEFKPAVSYEAHLLGFLVGIPLGIVIYLLQRRSILTHERWQ